MSLDYYFQAVRKRWLIVLSALLVGIVASIGITLLTKPTYEGGATLYIQLNQSTNQQSATFAQSLVQSYPSQVKSPSVLAPVIAELHLNTSVHQLDENVSAANPSGTLNLTVQAQSGTAKDAARLTNAVAHSLAREIDKLEAAKASVKGATPVTAQVTVPATLPTAPLSPRPALNIALGVLVGLALGACIAIMRERMDTTVKTVSDLSRLSGANPLGTIRYDPEFAEHAVVSMHEDSAAVEDFRSIRTNLQFVDVDNPPRVIVVSSAIADEGKSIAACNIAITMAQSNIRVCLVEGDLRRPRVASYLGIDGSLGLTDVVAGTHRLEDALIPWHRHELTVLPAGTTPPDPAQFLGSHAMSELLMELREQFDLVVIDAPPLLPVSDAAVLGAGSDGVILVARYRHVRRDQFAAALDALAAVRAKHLGSVLSRAPKHQRQGEYRYSPSPLGPQAEPSAGSSSQLSATETTLNGQSPKAFTKQWRPPPVVQNVAKRLPDDAPALVARSGNRHSARSNRPSRRRRQIG